MIKMTISLKDKALIDKYVRFAQSLDSDLYTPPKVNIVDEVM